ncbi:MAG: hypothetical protein AB1498_07605 [bacterium]
MKYFILIIISFIFIINIAFSQELQEYAPRAIPAPLNKKIDVNSFKVNIIGNILNKPIILTPENLGEWGKIYLNVIPPENYFSSAIVDISLDSGYLWETLTKSFYYEFEPEDKKTYILCVRISTNDDAGMKIFNEYPVTYLKNPEQHYSELVKNIFSIAFDNKDPSLFMKYFSNSYADSDDNRYEEIEDKFNMEFKKYSNIKFTLKNFEINRIDSAKFKVVFDWTKSSEYRENNNVEHYFGKSVYIFENDFIIQTGGDPIFFDSSAVKQLSKDYGVLKGGTVNLIPDESFDFSTEYFHKKETLKGDIGVKKNGNTLSLYVPGGAIQDMGIIQISEISEAPETGYSESAAVVIGHSYCLRNNNNRYAKLQVTYVEGAEVGQTSILVSINWIYQENESRILKPQ